MLGRTPVRIVYFDSHATPSPCMSENHFEQQVGPQSFTERPEGNFRPVVDPADSLGRTPAPSGAESLTQSCLIESVDALRRLSPRLHPPREGHTVMSITIGIHPHKASHTAVAVDDSETVIDEICIRSRPTQAVLLRDAFAPGRYGPAVVGSRYDLDAG